jgi:periplasmic nitrate reductase NapD
MHIAGVLVQSRPAQLPALKARLTKVSGLEIHHTGLDGRIIVTIEGAGRHAVANALTALQTLDGVLAASLVYETSDLEPLETP